MPKATRENDDSYTIGRRPQDNCKKWVLVAHGGIEPGKTTMVTIPQGIYVTFLYDIWKKDTAFMAPPSAYAIPKIIEANKENEYTWEPGTYRFPEFILDTMDDKTMGTPTGVLYDISAPGLTPEKEPFKVNFLQGEGSVYIQTVINEFAKLVGGLPEGQKRPCHNLYFMACGMRSNLRGNPERVGIIPGSTPFSNLMAIYAENRDLCVGYKTKERKPGKSLVETITDQRIKLADGTVLGTDDLVFRIDRGCPARPPVPKKRSTFASFSPFAGRRTFRRNPRSRLRRRRGTRRGRPNT